MTTGSRCPQQIQPTLNPTSIWNCLDLTKGHIGLIGVYIDFVVFRYQQVLDKYHNNQIQWEEKAREELTDWHIKTGVNSATQLTRAGTPAFLEENIEVEHALDAFYAEMILWKLGVGKEAQVLGYACLKFIELLKRKCLSKSTTN